MPVSTSEGLDKQNKTVQIKTVEDSQDNLEDMYTDSPLPGTSLVGVSGGRVGIDIIDVIRNKYCDDSCFKTIIAKPKESRTLRLLMMA